MPFYNFEATYTFTATETIWAEDEEDARSKVETLANVVWNGYSYPWDDVVIDDIWEDEYA